MPGHTPEERRRKRPFKIVEVSTGKVKGSSTNRKDAEARARNAK
ncbi:hypothetical protein LCGC14_0926980 [marine sediment metagenome]|uniref:Uncharacterized protein n=1 Tax=marine sediment metagenome TaxID=412755 RepID=A0A0F9PA02_9ZZZZ